MPNTLPLPYPPAGGGENRLNPDHLEPFNILTGLFIYHGSFAGVYTRAGTRPLIVGFQGGVTLGTLLADYDLNEATAQGLSIRPRALERLTF
jgi:hypothetical protein